MELSNTTDRKKVIQEICHSNAQNVSQSHFDAFMRFYSSIWRGQDNIFSISIREPVLSSHTDVINAVKSLRRSATLSKSSFQDQVFGDADELEKEHATRRIVKIAFMIDCSSKDDFSSNYQLCRSFPVKWTSTQTFIGFLESTFTRTGSRPFHERYSNRSMRAWKLKKRHGVRFVPTNDLVQHLLYDSRTSTVKIFHQTAFVKAHLLHTANLPLDTGFDDSVQSGSLPPQLLLETHLTLCYILFPVSTDRRTARFAKSLVKKRNLDPELMIDDGTIRDVPPDFKFVFWGERLRILEEINMKRPPRNKVISWMERHTSERNALTVAIIGLLLAVLFGFLGLLVGIAQLVVSILAWKYPTASTA